MRPISIRLDPDTIAELDAEAEEEGESRSSYLQSIIKDRNEYRELEAEYNRIQAENEKLQRERDRLKQENEAYEGAQQAIVEQQRDQTTELERLRADVDRLRREKNHHQEAAESAAMQRESIERIEEFIEEREASQAHRKQYRRANILQRLWWWIVGEPGEATARADGGHDESDEQLNQNTDSRYNERETGKEDKY